MHYTINIKSKGKQKKKYKVDFTVFSNDLSKKDEEKIYRIVRIIDSLGDDKEDEVSDKDYRFRTDDDDGKYLLDGVVKKDKEETKTLSHSSSSTQY